MFHDIKQLHAVSIWMTMDKVSFVFMVEFKELKKLLDGGMYKSVNDLVQKVLRTANLLMEEGLWTAYLVQWVCGNQYIYHSNLSQMHTCLISVPEEVNIPDEIVAQKLLFESLTFREKELFILLAKDYSLSLICRKLNIKLSTLKYHRNHIFEKMEFETRLNLVFWVNKFSKSLNL